MMDISIKRYQLLSCFLVIYLFCISKAYDTKESHQTIQETSKCNIEVKYKSRSEKHSMYYIDSGLFSILQYLKKSLKDYSTNNLVASIDVIAQHRHLYHNCLNVNKLLQTSNEAETQDRLFVSLKSPCGTISTKPITGW